MTPLRIHLLASACSGPGVGLAFVVTCASERTFSVWAPVTPYRLRAFENGEELAIVRPPLDLPAARQVWAVGPGSPVEIPCPVLLLFGSDGGDRDGLTWTVRRIPVPASVEIACGLEVDGIPLEAPAVSVDLTEVRG